ncbi:RING finger protein 214 [Heracleum sosnowskyi]|uniref:RING finger protein 214 n=1 Tax=Heracleum sosnowskyi TaxID=360622 RepID=A0AAD8J1I4_9APIA|nr:RING finger protein 214 [Heracleum sosnowskyi]
MEVVEIGVPIGERDQVRVKRKTLDAVLEQCQRALQFLSDTGYVDDVDDDDVDDDVSRVESSSSGAVPCQDRETDELCSLLKSRVESPDFLEKLESAQVSVPQNTPAEEGSTWDMINEKDVWESGYMNSEEEDYVLVRQEDIVDGIACFMAAYLLSLKQTKDLTPNQLQDALSKTFSLKKKKGKLRKAWDGSKVIYNVASWGATAIGIYQNPALLRAASAAFWTSCNVISKLF